MNVAFAVSFALVASLLVTPTTSVRAAGAETDAPAEMLIKMTVDPTPVPKPALKYQLLPELAEMTQGNPIPNYMKCLLDQDFSVPQETLGPAALKQADRAARMDKPDWQLLPKLKTDGFGLLLPDLQKMRGLAVSLDTRFRDEIALRRFDDALVTAKTMFALSRHMGEHPTLIGGLVAIAIAYVAIGPLEEMLQQPGAPNLYWGLTNLPTPFITLEKGMGGERMLTLSELGELDDTKPMTTAQLKKIMTRLDLLLEFGRNSQTTRTWLSERAKDEKTLETARRRLVESGIPAERIARFSNYQVLLLDEKLEYEIQRDESMKLLNLPTWEAIPRLDALPVPPINRPIARAILPALQKVRRAQGRLEQRIALLRHVEALRMYAAAHEGKLPLELADVSVPLPVDPFTGKPFRYEVADGVAHLRGTPPKGDEKNPAYNLHYEITIRK